MHLKIECPCGTKFAFDVEPENGRMPVAVNCPGCGAEATPLADAQIRSQLEAASASASAPAPAPARVMVRPVPSAAGGERIQVTVGPASGAASGRPAPVVPTGGGVRLSVAGHAAGGAEVPPAPVAEAAPAAPPATAPEAGGTAAVRCSRHPQREATETCFVCAKPICPECLAQFGYLCSPYCQEQARRRELEVPVYAGQKSVQWQKEVRTGNRLVTVLGVLAGLLVAGYVVYSFWLSRPRVAFTLGGSKGVPFVHAQFVGPGRILSATPQKVALRDWETDRELWAMALASPAAGGGAAGGPGLEGAGAMRVQVVGNEVWVANASRALQLDLGSGARKAELPLPAPVDSLVANDEGLLAVGATNEFSRTVTRVDFRTAKAATERIRLPAARRRVAPVNGDDADAPEAPPEIQSTLQPSGPGAVAMVARLVQARLSQRSAVKPGSAAVLERSGGPTAADSLEATREFLNEGQAPVTEDHSLYHVTLRRLFTGGAEWSGSVTGAPALFPLRTLDLLVAGTSVQAFDRNNRRLWETRLNYAIGPRFLDGAAAADGTEEEGGPPAVEAGNRIYFFDQGTLTALDARDGKALWRLPSVGISRVLPSGGSLYVASTTAGPESIQYSKDIVLNEKIARVLMRVEAGTGRLVWSQERMGDEPRTSGKFLYASTRKRYLMDGVGEGDERMHYYLRRIDPETGKARWEYYRRGPAESYEAEGSRLLLRFPEELVLLKYFSF